MILSFILDSTKFDFIGVVVTNPFTVGIFTKLDYFTNLTFLVSFMDILKTTNLSYFCILISLDFMSTLGYFTILTNPDFTSFIIPCLNLISFDSKTDFISLIFLNFN